MEAANKKQMKYDILCISLWCDLKGILFMYSSTVIIVKPSLSVDKQGQLVTGLRGSSHENFVSED